jgi:hypothetical protein
MSSFELTGSCLSDLNTEMRFLFAGARVDGEELVKIILPYTDNDKDRERISGCVLKVLRTLKKESVIQFYVNYSGFAANSTEASFLINNYGDVISDISCEPNSVYVKL